MGCGASTTKPAVQAAPAAGGEETRKSGDGEQTVGASSTDGARGAFEAFLLEARLTEFHSRLLAEGFDEVSVLSAVDPESVAALVGMRHGHVVKLKFALDREAGRAAAQAPGLFDLLSPAEVADATARLTPEVLRAAPFVEVPPRPPSAAWRAFLGAVRESGIARGKRVYLSYGWGPTHEHTDCAQTFLKCLATDLRACGVENVFVDFDSLAGDVEERLRSEIACTDVFIPLLSPALRNSISVRGGMARGEWKLISRAIERARDPATDAPVRNPIVLPLIANGMVSSEIFPLWMKRFLAVSIPGGAMYEDALSSLGSVSGQLGLIPAICGLDANNAGAYTEIVAMFHRDRNAVPPPLLPAKRPEGWAIFLSRLRELLAERETAPRRVFLSYAWEEDAGDGTDKSLTNRTLQEYLLGLKRDLEASGIEEVFLDIENMQGEISETMRKSIAVSDMVVFACTPRFRQRAMANTNVKFEINAALDVRKEGGNLQIAPIILRGDFAHVVPPALRGFLVRDLADPKAYASALAGSRNPIGLIPALLGISSRDDKYAVLVESLLA
jgi:hypothetical protein